MQGTKEFLQTLRSQKSRGGFEPQDGLLFALPLRNSNGFVRLFIDQDGSFGLLVPLGSKDPKWLQADTHSEQIKLHCKSLEGKPHAEVRLFSSAFEEVFCAFSDSLLEEIEQSPENAGLAASAQLTKWRALFNLEQSKALSASEEIGLICELQTMNELLENGQQNAFFRWTGPDSQHHDFRFEDRGIECKATTVTKGLPVAIHDARQLESEPGRKLLLRVAKYEASPNGEITLRTLVTRLLQRKEVPADEFLIELKKVGYSLPAWGEDNFESAYHLLETQTFEVTKDFPRISPESLPDRIGSVQYTIELTEPERVPGHRKDGSLRYE